MKFYLNSGFGSPIGNTDLTTIHRLSFAGCRNDIPEHLPPVLAKEIVTEQTPHDLRPLFLVNGGYMPWGHAHTVAVAVFIAQVMDTFGIQGEIEIGNEPDLSRYSGDPKAVGRMLVEVHARLRDVGIGTRLVLGGIMTTSKEKLAYLESMVSVGLPTDVIIGYHTYRQWKRPSQPHKGFRTREAEFIRLQEIAGGRELWNTETGWHTAEEGKLFCKKKLSDSQVYERLMEEASYNKWAGAKVMTVYQLQDGLSDKSIDRFGIRRADGVTYKPSAYVAERAA